VGLIPLLRGVLEGECVGVAGLVRALGLEGHGTGDGGGWWRREVGCCWCC